MTAKSKIAVAQEGTRELHHRHENSSCLFIWNKYEYKNRFLQAVFSQLQSQPIRKMKRCEKGWILSHEKRKMFLCITNIYVTMETKRQGAYLHVQPLFLCHYCTYCSLMYRSAALWPTDHVSSVSIFISLRNIIRRGINEKETLLKADIKLKRVLTR